MLVSSSELTLVLVAAFHLLYCIYTYIHIYIYTYTFIFVYLHIYKCFPTPLRLWQLLPMSVAASVLNLVVVAAFYPSYGIYTNISIHIHIFAYLHIYKYFPNPLRLWQLFLLSVALSLLPRVGAVASHSLLYIPMHIYILKFTYIYIFRYVNISF